MALLLIELDWRTCFGPKPEMNFYLKCKDNWFPTPEGERGLQIRGLPSHVVTDYLLSHIFLWEMNSRANTALSYISIITLFSCFTKLFLLPLGTLNESLVEKGRNFLPNVFERHNAFFLFRTWREAEDKSYHTFGHFCPYYQHPRQTGLDCPFLGRPVGS